MARKGFLMAALAVSTSAVIGMASAMQRRRFHSQSPRQTSYLPTKPIMATSLQPAPCATLAHS